VLGGQHDGGQVRHDLPVHGGRVRVERFDTEALTDGPPPVRVDLSNRDQFSIREGLIDLGVVLTETPATDDGNGVFGFSHDWTYLRSQA
jgi:hypothetical protein